jgi:hypothetical protein
MTTVTDTGSDLFAWAKDLERENKRIAEINAQRMRNRGYLVFATDPSVSQRLDVRLSVGVGCKIQKVGGQGKPVRIRRGPATVTGDAHRGAPCRCAATKSPPAAREGAEG